MDYWDECIAEALEDAEIIATKEQIETIASWVESAHENYGMAHGHNCIPNPLEAENKELKRELKKEIEKIHCEECNGKGHITINYGFRSTSSSCWKCRGQGRYAL